MPTSPNTYGIAQSIQTIMQGTKVSGQPAYANVIIGGVKDYTDITPLGAIAAVSGSVERYTLGRAAKIHDKTRFNIASVVSYTNAATAEQQIYGIRDAVTFQFAQSAQLNMQGPVIINVVPSSERWSYLTVNGIKWRVHEFRLEVIYEYTLPQGPQP